MIRPDQVLTGSYVAGNILETINYKQVTIYVEYTKGDETSMQVKVETGNDTTTMYQDTEYTYAGGVDTGVPKVVTYSATGNYRIPLPVTDKYLKVSVQATGGTPTGTAMVDAYLGQD